MSSEIPVIDRPQRWGRAFEFDPDMPAGDYARILSVAPFANMDVRRFPKHIPLHGIVRNDIRVRRFAKGEIIVRAGDYGTSAFMVLNGRVRVVVSPGLPDRILGRRESKRKSLVSVVAQLWSNSSQPEQAHRSQFEHDFRIHSADGGRKGATIFLQDVPRVLDRHRTAMLEQGEFFGEIAALSRMPRTATVFAEDVGVELLEIRWQGLRDLMRYDDALKRHIDGIYRERALETYLLEIPIFQHLGQSGMQEVIRHAEFETHGDYDWSGSYKQLGEAEREKLASREPVIAQEGDYANGVYLIRAGFARLSHKFGLGQRTLNYLGAGHIYGLEEIAHNYLDRAGSHLSLRHSLRVAGYTHLILIPTAIMEGVVLPSLPREQVAQLAAPAADPEPSEEDDGAAGGIAVDILEFLAGNRFFNGRATMVIDLARCTRCDDCVRACAHAHDNNPRFLRHGPSAGQFMVANACMHCADPVCMIGCPTGSIHRSSFEGQVIINPATCVGCKACYSNCPFDAIRMVEARSESGDIMVDRDMKPINLATKCDLCVEQIAGPACQRACPHDAMARLNLNNLESLAKWLNRN